VPPFNSSPHTIQQTPFDEAWMMDEAGSEDYSFIIMLLKPNGRGWLEMPRDMVALAGMCDPDRHRRSGAA
jgi:hypothetical protein